MSITNITEDQVKELLDLPTVCDAIEQSLRSVCEVRPKDAPNSSQPARTFTRSQDGKGILLSMPGFLGNYKLAKTVPDQPSRVFNTLGCKLVTSFSKNSELNPPKPNVLANIFLFNENTGELKAIVQATEITAWRTAAASIVATQYLYLERSSVHEAPYLPKTLAVLGCGIQVI